MFGADMAKIMVIQLRAVVQPLPWPLLLLNRRNHESRLCIFQGLAGPQPKGYPGIKCVKQWDGFQDSAPSKIKGQCAGNTLMTHEIRVVSKKNDVEICQLEHTLFLQVYMYVFVVCKI